MPGEAQPTVADRLLAWWDVHGRHDLPWQQRRTPSREWISEIMLQQTQVGTVIPYYARFMAQFPSLCDLADASQDQVLHLWSGLGYYARARNLHRAAQLIRDEHNGRFPIDLTRLQALPGIGRSTAGAILSLALGQPHAILDGNVKRVLARHFALAGWPGKASVLRQFWELAERYTPRTQTAAYNQAMMDLGSLVCRRAAPDCGACPLRDSCQALAQGRTGELPSPKPGKALPVRSRQFMAVRNQEGAVLLERRPPAGIWGGLWSLPECPAEQDPAAWCREQFAVEADAIRRLARRRHSFSHFHLDITPVEIRLNNPSNSVMDDGARVWYKLANPDMRGLAAPVSRILDELQPNATGERG